MNNLQYLIRNRYRKNRKAVSPVISTIIIVAIAIAISIAVALYLTGITSTFTKFERLDTTSAYASPLVSGYSSVELSLKNSGTSTLTVDRVLLNGKPTDMYVGWTPTTGYAQGTSIANITNTQYNLNGVGQVGIVQGDSGTMKISIAGKSGQSIEITLHTASGKEYPKVVMLP